MKLTRSSTAVVLGLALFLSSAKVFAGSALEDFQRLTPAEQKAVQDGGQVVQFGTETPWPSVILYQRVHVTPEEATAVFFDYAYQKEYIPNLITVVPNQVSSTVYDVDYLVKIPFVPTWLGGTEKYRVRDELATYDNGHAYEFKWKLVPGHGETTQSSDGSLKVEGFGTDTLLVYYSYIIPGRIGSGNGYVVDGAKDAVKKAFTAIVNQIEKVKSDYNPFLQTKIEKLREALSN